MSGDKMSRYKVILDYAHEDLRILAQQAWYWEGNIQAVLVTSIEDEG